MNKDRKKMKKVAERFLAHALEIIYLLTGEEYTIVKKSSPHSSIHQLTGEVPIKCDDVAVYFSMDEWKYIEGHKEHYKDVMMEDHQSLKILGNVAIKNSVHSDENLGTVSVIVDEDDEESIGTDIQQIEVQSETCAGDFSAGVVQVQAGELSASHQLEMQEQEIQEYNSTVTVPLSPKDEFRNWNSSGVDQSPQTGRHLVIEDIYVAKGYQEADNINTNPPCNISVRTVGKDVHPSDHHPLVHREDPMTEYMVNYPNKCIEEPTYVSGIHKSNKKHNYSVHGGNALTNKPQIIVPHIIDTREGPLICPECGKCFMNVRQLVIHQRIHTAEKPFKCCVCGKCFRWKSHFLQHQRMHTGEKPFSCSECENCYSQKSHLVRHKKFAHGIQN